jgi:hypothetical protein
MLKVSNSIFYFILILLLFLKYACALTDVNIGILTAET